MVQRSETGKNRSRTVPCTGHAAGILLAAGISKRFGRPKQLALLGGRSLLRRVLDSALASDLEKVYLVLGHDSGQVRKHLRPYGGKTKLELVDNPDYLRGMGSSLARGIEAAGDNWRAYMVLLADQPLVTPELINSMLAALSGSNKSIAVPVFKGRRGNPVLFSGRWYSDLCRLKDDFGGRHLVAANPAEVTEVEVDAEHYFWDVDRREDLKRLESFRLPARSSGRQ